MIQWGAADYCVPLLSGKGRRMRHEFSDEIEVHYETPLAPSVEPVQAVEPRPVQGQSRSTTLVNHGCVSAASFTLWMLAVLAVFGFFTSLATGDGLRALANGLETLLIGATAVGLRLRHRWSVYLVLMVCLMLGGELIASSVVLALEIVNRYLTHTASRVVVWGFIGFSHLTIIAVMSAIGWWFWRRRLRFLSYPPIEEWGYRLYLVAFVIAVAAIIADSAVTYYSLDELIRPYADEFRNLDQSMQQFG